VLVPGGGLLRCDNIADYGLVRVAVAASDNWNEEGSEKRQDREVFFHVAPTLGGEGQRKKLKN
jgi:hypothetical protein